ncbi:Transcription intermediary factor 1-beta [Holothuria leucospilota]|uniref:Transcription intermediary factor 1-beta n=1 Tax=Holothuria leucospilota TaxID=206669 RepID=A0A9Q1BTZ5_HOLLE|nr:Transcription intermediary factor 1-beta [Holothuria leucospilota]
MRECYGCSKQLRVTAYCFKCNDFLCQDCHNFHVKNKFLKDHQKHTLSLVDIESKSITIEKLASMRDAPRCVTHPEKISELYCKTCDDLPVCMACMLGVHKGHDLHEVRALAKAKREMLAQQLETLEKLHKERNLTIPGQAKEKLFSNVKREKESLLKTYESKVKKTKTKIDDVEKSGQQIKLEKQNTEKQIFDLLQREKEKEIRMVNKKYEELFKLKKTESSNLLKYRESSVERELAQLIKKLYHFDRDKEELLDSIKIELNKNLKDIEAMLEYFEKTNKQFKNLHALASSVIASENDWTAALCIPDIQAAAENLIKDLRKDFPELQTLSNVQINYKKLCSFRKPDMSKISEQMEKKITLSNTFHYVNGVTSSGEGNIVISGCPLAENKALIAVIDLDGKILRQKKITAETSIPWHPCDFLSQNKMATICQPNTVGVYDILGDSYITKNISDVISSWPRDRCVRCVGTDPINNHILVGGEDSRDVYVFDDQLNYLHTLTLPEIIKWPRDITVSDGHLLVCDFKGGKAYVTTMNEDVCRVVGEFKKPDMDDLTPWSVCTDKLGLVYMLWRYGIWGQCYLVQYNFDGSQLITTREMDDRGYVVAVVDTIQGEKLLLATHDTQTVYVYDLIEED